MIHTIYCPYTDTEYQVIQSQAGRNLLLVDGYTFCQTQPHSNYYWRCSRKTSNCKAKLKLNEQHRIISLLNEHCHPKRQTIRTSNGKIVRV